MNKNTRGLITKIGKSKESVGQEEELETGPVDRIARAYEVARNALEYRAEHLVRRAAIERIIKRQLVFSSKPEVMAGELLTELKWAKYLKSPESQEKIEQHIKRILEKYYAWWNFNKWDKDWLVGLVSAEIEENLNPNRDYHEFTKFAFHALKQIIDSSDIENFDLLLFVAVDKAFAQADNQQVSYHLMNLIVHQSGKENAEKLEELLSETYKYYHMANNHPLINKLGVIVRRWMGAMVLVRDLYFSRPDEFEKLTDDEKDFKSRCEQVLRGQLGILKGRMNTAGVRSLIYVFLTKMLFALILEIPAEKWLAGEINWLILGINTLFPVILMWLLIANIKLPDSKSQEKLVNRAWLLVAADEGQWTGNEKISLTESKKGVIQQTFYILYGGLFATIFLLIVYNLMKAGFSIISTLVFVFFLTVVSFFAYRIRQTAQIYSYRSGRGFSSSVWEMLMLPIIAAGGALSKGVSKLNFLVFIFDFVLEAPFKMILRILDNWFDFLSRKRDEVIG